MITALDATSILQSYDDVSKAVITIAGSSARRVEIREADLQDIAKLATAVDEARAGLWTARLQSPRDGAAEISLNNRNKIVAGLHCQSGA
jgi:hypothetical protein